MNAKHKAIELSKKSVESHKLADIDYYRKNVYGNELNYIHHPDIAAAHRKLTGQSTLSGNHIDAYSALGHKVTHVPKN